MTQTLSSLAFPQALQARLIALQGESRSIIDEKNGSRLGRASVAAVFLAPEAASTADRLRWLHRTVGGGALEAVVREEIQARDLPNASRTCLELKTPSHQYDFNYFSLRGRADVNKGEPLSIPLWTAEMGHWAHDPAALPAIFQDALASFCAATTDRAAISFLGPADLRKLCDGVAAEHPDVASRAAKGEGAGGGFGAYDAIRDMLSSQPKAHSSFLARLASALEALDLQVAANLPAESNRPPAGAPRSSSSPARVAARL